MESTAIISRIKTELLETFTLLDSYFELLASVRHVQPAPNEWSIDEILEHISLTNHFLMITLDNSRKKVLRRAETQPIPDTESDLDNIQIIADPDAFDWVRPEHMEPTRTKPMSEVRQTLQEQMQTCLTILDDIKNGEGKLHTVRMSVQDLGKLDMYQWLYFLVQHAKRHTIEIERIVSG